ncbi:MAG: 2-hydroxyglutaryl-CoA dehydratase [Oscillospiraceae bacterium]|jgi:predicted nucleotide-binding protein (sugar kinase/HSP70/actin superfamily)|nr:2-hydroxyglutaryl-CoA dehydratase [Oscillospiraceae bacterium]MCX4256857.1 2-hydroxyacyl-CoA dehydratase [Oscillospiraceae bacterium]
MKQTHTILIPDMLPIHFGLIMEIFRNNGYKMELLTTSTRSVVDEGLKHVHNDTCYPALLVIGQFIDALKSGKYDVNKVALLISQTGGGCRASNYIHLLRKALDEEFPQIPVLSLNFSGLEKDSGFKITAGMFLQMLYAVLYGDLMMSLYNTCRAYELNKGDSKAVLEKWQTKIAELFRKGGYRKTKKLYREILADFSQIKRTKEKKVRVGIVGEIYVKYSPLANNHLEDFLISEGCEPVVPAFLDFCLYCAVNTVNDGKIYNFSTKTTKLFGIAYRLIYSMQKQMIKIVREHGEFDPPHDFEDLRAYADKYMHQGVKMGEGWLIPAEMAALAHGGVENIICTQPFGCLPNHIVAKGMSRVIKEAFPQANIVAVDYDPGATRVNQENRIKLMLANARKEI